MSSPAITTPFRARPLDATALTSLLVAIAAGISFPFPAVSGVLCAIGCALGVIARRRLVGNPLVMGAEVAELSIRISLAVFAMATLPRLAATLIAFF